MIENLADKFFEINWLIFFSIFVGYAIVDSLYTKYTLDVVETKPFSAANSSTLIYLLLAFGVLNFTENIWYLLPLLVGSWVGTYTFIKFRENKLKNQQQ